MVLVVAGWLPNAAPAQGATERIKIQVAVNDSMGVVQSALVTAFRALGDVDVVTGQESPHLILDGVPVCEPNCSRATGFVVALRLAEPMQRSMANRLVKDTAWQGVLTRLERPISMWLAQWDRADLDRHARDFVALINTRCFERKRILSRAMAMQSRRDSSGARRLMGELRNYNDLVC